MVYPFLIYVTKVSQAYLASSNCCRNTLFEHIYGNPPCVFFPYIGVNLSKLFINKKHLFGLYRRQPIINVLRYVLTNTVKLQT